MGKSPQKVFVVDIARCNGCYCCQIACKDEHVGNDWSPYAKPQPDTGQFWCRLNEYVRGTVPKVKLHYVAVPCQHCAEAPCLDACPTGAMKFGDESDFAAEIAQATVLGPADKTKPRVYYLNIPGRFIAGLVYDPVEKEIVEGARCILVDAETGEKRVVKTDGFGDFWFVGLGEKTFSLMIEAEGFAPISYSALDTRDDINLGEVSLSPER